MSGSTISSTITNSVTLGTGGSDSSPLAITNNRAGPAGLPNVTLFARNPQISFQIQANLTSIGIAVTVINPGGILKDLLPIVTASSVLIVHRPDWEGAAAMLSYADPGRRPALVLVDEIADPSLQAIETRWRCVTQISNQASATVLRQGMMIALRLGKMKKPETAGEVLAPPPGAARQRRVLLADDNRVNQQVVSLILKGAGHAMRVAENGDIALNILEREADALDIVLMDINMPELDGLEVTKLFRAMSCSDSRLPIIGLTATAAAQTDQRWRAAGMDGCLIKPIEPAALLKVINTMSRAPLAAGDNIVAARRQHPRFRTAVTPALDEAVIANLRLIGDHEFVRELMEEFMSDTSGLIDTLKAAAYRGDTAAFRFQAHALQSGAASVGAVALRELCAPWAGLRGNELRGRADQFAARAQTELKRTRDAFWGQNASYRADSV